MVMLSVFGDVRVLWVRDCSRMLVMLRVMFIVMLVVSCGICEF